MTTPLYQSLDRAIGVTRRTREMLTPLCAKGDTAAAIDALLLGNQLVLLQAARDTSARLARIEASLNEPTIENVIAIEKPAAA